MTFCSSIFYLQVILCGDYPQGETIYNVMHKLLTLTRVPLSQRGCLNLKSLYHRNPVLTSYHSKHFRVSSKFSAFQNVGPPSTPVKTWVDHFPVKVRPYLYLTRIDKPIGTLLLFYPCAWSITMASYALELPYTVPLTYISLFGVGAILMRSAGCTINDMWDRNLDKAVARTRERPLAKGDITFSQSVVFLGAQLSAGLGVLLQLNWYSILLGASSLSVVTIYPAMKRVTHWPQAVLGLAFNWGAFLGWSAVAGTTDWTVCLPLYAGGICWTLVYDSIYAHQDKVDDVNAGIRSTALLFGTHSRPILGGLSVSSLSLVSYAGYLNAQGSLFYVGVGLAAVQLGRVLYQTDFDSRSSCWKGFVGCGWAGFWIWMGSLGDYVSLMSVSG